MSKTCSGKPPRCRGFMRHRWVEFRGKTACDRCLKPRNPKAKPLGELGGRRE